MKNMILAALAALVGLPLRAATVTIPSGETWKLGETSTTIDSSTDLVLLGTLDLNGQDLTIQSIKCLDEGAGKIGTFTISATGAKIVNTGAGTPTLTIQGGALYYTGSVADSLNVTFNGSDAQVFSADGTFAPAKLTVVKGTFMAFARPTTFYFRVDDVAGDAAGGSKYLRLGELMYTYRGIPVEKYARTITNGDKSNWFDLNPLSYQYWSNTKSVSESKPNASVTAGSAGNADSTGIAAIDGYRLVPAEPAYAPTTWQVYGARGANTGAILLDAHTDDPLNRGSIAHDTTLENKWSSRLSQDFGFNRHKLGCPLGVNMAIDLLGTSVLRLSAVASAKVGTLTGTGTVRLDDGTSFEPQSTVDWTGEIVTYYSDAEFGRAAMSANATINPGAGVTVDLDPALTYAGATTVKSGMARVAGVQSSVTGRYLRLTPLAVQGGTANVYKIYWGMNEFAVYDAEGKVVSLSGSTVTCSGGFNSLATNGSKLFDGDITSASRCLPKNESSSALLPVLVDAGREITFAAFDWVPTYAAATPTGADKYRFVTELLIEVSSDNQNWIVADRRTYAVPTDDSGYKIWQGGATHFALNGGLKKASYPTLPEEFVGSRANGRVKSIKAKYLRFSPYETFFGGKYSNENYYGWNVSEFSILKDGEIVPWPAGVGVAIERMNITVKTFGNALANFANNVHTGGEGNVDNAVRCFVDQCGGSIVVNVGAEPIEFDAYELWNASHPSFTRRLPRVWSLEISNDRTTWYTVDNHAASEGDVCPGVYGVYGPFSLKNRYHTSGMTDAFADDATLTIASGATVSIASAGECLGNLSGVGSVYLAGASLNLVGSLTRQSFGGSIAGGGTLVLTGTQFFDNADLTGVKTLVFDGGAIGGSATFGALDVTGQVQYELAMTAEEIAKGSCTRQILTVTSLTAGAKTALAAGTAKTPLPSRGWNLTVVVTDTTVTVKARRNGMVVVVR